MSKILYAIKGSPRGDMSYAVLQSRRREGYNFALALIFPSIQAAKLMTDHGIDVEVVDLELLFLWIENNIKLRLKNGGYLPFKKTPKGWVGELKLSHSS
ncbi:MAG: hypothetical protein CM15mP111_1190 [Hyphomicrobiales bacterium]|nr:MAG: hypothetical protein CM15mP111_1190 [Hyphomicrobiales bacterium]